MGRFGGGSSILKDHEYRHEGIVTEKLMVILMVFTLFASFSVQGQSVDLTPDMAAPVPPQNDPNPPKANNIPDDAAIQIAAESTLPASAAGLFVSVDHGVVHLKGTLLTENEFLEAISNVFTAQGVVGVDASNLHIQYSHQNQADLMSTARVMGTLMKTNIFGKDPSAWPIHIETKQQHVYISGTVSTAAEKQQLLNVIHCMKDIGPVSSDQLFVKP